MVCSPSFESRLKILPLNSQRVQRDIIENLKFFGDAVKLFGGVGRSSLIMLLYSQVLFMTLFFLSC